MFGSVAMTRTATSPPGSISSRASRWPAGIFSPHAVSHTRAKAASMSATAGPRISTPVSRHGSMFFAGRPSQSCPTHSPMTKPSCPSTEIILRWSRLSQPKGSSKRGGLKPLTSTPASRKLRQKRREVLPTAPSQS